MKPFSPGRLLKGVSAGIFGTLTRLIIQLAQVPILFSAWGAEQASAWLMLWTLPSYMSLMVGAFNSAGGNMAVAAGREGNMGDLRAAYRATQRVINVSNILLTLVFGVSYVLILRDPSWGIEFDELVLSVVLISVYVAARIQASLFEVAYRCGSDYGESHFIESGVTLAELAIMFLVTWSTQSIVMLPAALAALRVVSGCLVWLRVRRRWPELLMPAGGEEISRSVKSMWRPFFGFALAPVILLINLNGYALIVGDVFGPALFAIFITTRILSRLLDHGCSLAYTVLFNEFAYFDLKKNRDLAIGSIAITCAALAGIGTIYGAMLLLAGDAIQHIWTDGQVPFHQGLAAVFLVAAMFRSVSVPYVAFLSSRNAHVSISVIYLTGTAAAFAMAFIAARMGASLVEVSAFVILAEVTQFLAVHVIVSRELGERPTGLLVRMVRDGPASVRQLRQLVRAQLASRKR